MVDPGNLSSSKTIGSSFLAYCSVSCSHPKNESEYIQISLALKPGAPRPVYYSGPGGVGDTAQTYSISHLEGGAPVTSRDNSWTFVPVPQDQGFFFIQHGKMYLGVLGGDTGRAWGARVRLSAPIPSKSGAPERSRQQWYFERIKAIGGLLPSAVSYRLINRYSGLALSFRGDALAASDLEGALTAPARDWDSATERPIPAFKVWRAYDQELVLKAVVTSLK
jgi:hypothetical protein